MWIHRPACNFAVLIDSENLAELYVHGVIYVHGSDLFYEIRAFPAFFLFLSALPPF